MATTTRRAQIDMRFKDQLSKELQQAQKGFASLGASAVGALKSIAGSLNSARTLITGFVGYLAVRRSFGLLKGIADDLDFIVKTSDRLQVTTDSLQKVQFVASLAGVEFERFAQGLGTVSKNIVVAREGSLKLRDAFHDLGVDINNLPIGPGGKIDLIQLLSQVADSFDAAGDAAAKSGKLQIAFGRQGKELGPLLAQGSQAIREQVEQFERLGGVFSAEQLARAAAFNDSLTRVQTAVSGVKRTLFVEFAPEVAALLEKLAEFVAQNKDAILEAAKDVASAFVQILDLAANAVLGFIALLEKIPGIQLFDEAQVKGQILIVERELRKVEAFQIRNAERQKLLAQATTPEQRADVRRGTEVGRIRAGTSLLSRDVEQRIVSQLDRRNELQRELAELSETLTGGIGLVLRSQKDRIKSEIEAIADAIRTQDVGDASSVTGQARIDGNEQVSEEILRQETELQQKLRELRATGIEAEVVALENATFREIAALDRQFQDEGELREKAKEVAKAIQEKLFADLAALREKHVAAEKAGQDEITENQRKAAEREAQILADARKRAQEDAQRFEEQTQFGAGFAAGLRDVNQELQSFGAVGRQVALEVSDTFISGAREMGAAFARSSAEGKAAFEDFSKRVIQLIGEIVAEAAAAQVAALLASSLTAEKGAVVEGRRYGGNIQTRQFDAGGFVSRPTLALFGEGKQREAFVPLPDGRAIPAVVTDHGSAGATIGELHFHVNAIDGASVERFFDEHRDTVLATVHEGFETRTRMRQLRRG